MATRTPFLLVFRNTGPENHAHLSPADQQTLLKQWNAWYDDLAHQGLALSGQPLDEASRVISGVAGQRVIDGPFPEAKEAIGGYVALLATSIEEATERARTHPGLAYGMKIEIRPFAQNCHLGVVGRSADR